MPKSKLNLDHLDAAENLFFQRQLELIDPKMYAVKYAERRARMFVQTGDMLPEGIEMYTYQQSDARGKAKFISSAAEDLPQSNVLATESSAKLKNIGAAYSYDLDELKAAAQAGRPLDSMRANTARDAIAQKLDDVIASGDTAAGMKGLLNLSDVQNVTAGLTGTWSGATADVIIDDLMKIIDAVPENTSDVESAKRLILPSIELRRINRKPRSTTSDTTILQFLKENRPDVEIMSWERCNAAGAGGKNRVVAYDPSVDVVRLLMAFELETLAPQQKNFSFIVNMRARTGGVIAYRPKAICYGDV